jgi:predicted dienelactone hydrolase
MIRLSGLAAFAAALVCAATAHAAVGFQHFTIPDPDGPPIEVGVWYPTDAAPSPTRVELFSEPMAKDGPVKGRGLPLVVISHGNGGSYAGHVDTAVALAEAGFVAAAVTHTGDNWRDQKAATRVWERPRHLKLLTDYMLGAWSDHDRLDADKVGAFGFSAGGLTVLAAAGGEPDLSKVAEHCKAHPDFFECGLVIRLSRQFLAAVPPGIVWTHDTRIKAVVSAAPALGYTFDRAGLAGVRQPLQLWRGENDAVLPHPYYAEAVRLALPTPPETHVVPGAGHYDFLAPCSPELAKVNAMICASAPGFDRGAFHAAFNRDVVAFFVRSLGRPSGDRAPSSSGSTASGSR